MPPQHPDSPQARLVYSLLADNLNDLAAFLHAAGSFPQAAVTVVIVDGDLYMADGSNEPKGSQLAVISLLRAAIAAISELS